MSFKNFFSSKNYIKSFNFLNFKTSNFGYYFFYIGIFLLVSAPAISVLFLVISFIISTIKSKSTFFKDDLNLFLIILSAILVISSGFNFFHSLAKDNQFNSFDFFTGLANYLPLFWVYWAAQHYLKTTKERKKISILFISGNIPLFISQFLQHLNFISENNFINTPLKTLNGSITWFLKSSPDLYGYGGLFSNSNYLAAWLLIIFPLSIATLIEKPKNFRNFYISFIFLILISASLIISYSRMGLISIPINLTIFFTNKLFLIFTFTSFLLIFFLLLGFFLSKLFSSLIIIFPFNLHENFEFEALINNLLNAPRFSIWIDSLKFISEKPLFGWGSSTYPKVYEFLGSRTNITHAHNLPFEIAYNYGILPALLLIFFFLFILIKASVKQGKSESRDFKLQTKRSYSIFNKAWISAIIVLGISQLVDIQYYDLRISIGMWIILSGLRAFILEKEDLLNKI